MNPEELDVLVKRVQDGDSNAFTDLFVAVQKPLRIFLSVYASSEEMVDEVFQAAFVTGYEKIRTYKLQRTFLPWLKGIARNLLLQEFDERARLVATEGDKLEGMLLLSGLSSLKNASAEEDRERDGQLKKCLEKLPSHSRELLELRYGTDVPLKKMALVLKKTETWIGVTLHRIRESLRICMTKVEPNL